MPSTVNKKESELISQRTFTPPDEYDILVCIESQVSPIHLEEGGFDSVLQAFNKLHNGGLDDVLQNNNKLQISD